MKRLLFLGIITLGLTCQGQSDLPTLPKIEVGIEEKLGTVVPLDLQFLNDKGDTVTLGQLIDKPTILTFVYYDCPSICGPFQSGIAEFIPKIGMELGKEYQIITISFNPLDTPEKGVQKKQNYIQQIPEEQQKHWIYLTGWQENITRITSVVGYYYKPTGLDFAHPSALIVLSPQGKVTRYLFGISFLPFDVKMAIIEAQKGLERPAINKVLELCFSYDNKSRSYTLQITSIVGGITILAALVVLAVLIFKRKKTAKS